MLSGPSFASELARKLPTAIVAAGDSPAVVESVMAHFRSPALRLYGSSDVVGVELGGSLKNIIAIAAGVVEGLGLGHNALAALITRGLAELSRLAVALGAQRDTLAGLAGLGDLVLTCTGDLSRNRRVGLALAKGQSLEDILASTKMVAEGVRTTEAALALSAKHGIELPIASEMSDVLSGRTDPQTAIRNLMGRKQKLNTQSKRRDPASMGLFDKLKQGLQRTTQQFKDRLDRSTRCQPRGRAGGAHARDRRRDAESARRDPVMADVGVAASGEIVEAVRKRQRRGESLRELVKQEILRMLEIADARRRGDRRASRT